MEYGVAVNNKFALFDNEDEDPLEVLQRTQEMAVKKPAVKITKDSKENSNVKVSAKNAKNVTKEVKPAAKSVQPAKVLTPAQEQKPKPVAQNQNPQPRRENTATEKPPRFRQNDNVQRERRPPREENQDQQRTDAEFRPDRTEQRTERDNFHGRGGGFRRGRGQRGGLNSNEGGFDRFGKREFERHSGSDRTGLKPVEKREGGGAHNWGTIADAVAEQEQSVAREAPEQVTEGETVTSPGEEEPAVDAEAAEPEEKQLTLDEWKVLQDRERSKTALNLRKAGEGVSIAPEWKKMFVLKKKVEQEHEAEEDEEDDDEEELRGKHKTHVPIQIKFNDTGARGGAGGGGGFNRGRGRGGRGGTGGRRPGGDHDGDRPRRSDARAEAVPNVDNELDFPSLA